MLCVVYGLILLGMMGSDCGEIEKPFMFFFSEFKVLLGYIFNEMEKMLNDKTFL